MDMNKTTVALATRALLPVKNLPAATITLFDNVA